MIRKFFEKLFCRHDYEQIGWDEMEDNNTRYSVRYYMCKKCGKYITVDGRNDPYMDRGVPLHRGNRYCR